jgi:hypothetical protein
MVWCTTAQATSVHSVQSASIDIRDRTISNGMCCSRSLESIKLLTDVRNRHVRVHHVNKDRDDNVLRDVLNQRTEGQGKTRRRRTNTGPPMATASL